MDGVNFFYHEFILESGTMYINLKMAERNVDIRHVTGIKVAQ